MGYLNDTQRVFFLNKLSLFDQVPIWQPYANAGSINKCFYWFNYAVDSLSRNWRISPSECMSFPISKNAKILSWYTEVYLQCAAFMFYCFRWSFCEVQRVNELCLQYENWKSSYCHSWQWTYQGTVLLEFLLFSITLSFKAFHMAEYSLIMFAMVSLLSVIISRLLLFVVSSFLFCQQGWSFVIVHLCYH